MIRSNHFYFRKGRQKQRRYFKGNFLGLYFYAFYALAALLGDFLCIGFPLFSSSGYNIFRMIDETDDAYITKSFDGGDDRKNYLSRFLFALFIVLFIVLGVFILRFLMSFIGGFLTPIFGGEEAVKDVNYQVFYWLISGVFILFAALTGIVLLMVMQIGSYIGAKNHALGVGDLAFNSVNFVLKRGFKLFFLDFIITIFYMLVPALFIGGYIALTSLGVKYDNLLLSIIGYSLALVLVLISPMFIGRYALTLRMATTYLFEDAVDTSAYKVVYPEKPGKKKGEEGVRGHYIEAIPLDEAADEATPIEVDTKEEDK